MSVYIYILVSHEMILVARVRSNFVQKASCVQLAWSMQCPGCRNVQFSRHWTPAQWDAEDPYIHGRQYCTICDPEWTGSTYAEACEHVEAVRCLLQLFHTHHCEHHFTAFLNAWKDKVMCEPKVYRPLHGAGKIILRPGGGWEDAGNCTYLMVLRFLCPAFIQANWHVIKAVPLGNILESILGYFQLRAGALSINAKGFQAYIYTIIRCVRKLAPVLTNTAEAEDRIWRFQDLEALVHSRRFKWAQVIVCETRRGPSSQQSPDAEPKGFQPVWC